MSYEYYTTQNSNYTIFFIRTQKKYNKMRYARSRRYSRVSFFGGLFFGIVFLQFIENFVVGFSLKF